MILVFRRSLFFFHWYFHPFGLSVNWKTIVLTLSFLILLHDTLCLFTLITWNNDFVYSLGNRPPTEGLSSWIYSFDFELNLWKGHWLTSFYSESVSVCKLVANRYVNTWRSVEYRFIPFVNRHRLVH